MNDFRVLLQAVLDSNSIGQDDINKIQKVISKYHLNLTADLDKASVIAEIKKIVPQLEAELKKMTGVDIQINDSALLKAFNQIEKQAESTAQKLNKFQLSTDITKIENDYKRFGIASQEVENNLKELKSAHDAVLKAEGTNRLSTEIDKYNQKLAETKSSWKELQATQVSANQRTFQMTAMQEWMRKNQKATKLCGDQVQKLIQECRTCDKVRFDGIQREFKELQVVAGKAGKLGNTLWGSLVEQGKGFVQWYGISGAITSCVNALRKMYTAVYDIDTAMTNLYKVTDENNNRYNEFLTNASKNAKELGRSVSSLVEQTANWSKLGYSLDDAERLAQISSIYSNVGEVDDATAVSDMVTAMKAFNIEASDAITIVDALNTLGNKYATSASDLGAGLARSASAMAVAGTDMQKTLAMLTGGAEITQNADEFGNMLKVGSMRIQGMKGKLEELGEEVDENIESISKMQTQVLNLTHGNVNIFDNAGNFRDYYDIMEDISEVYDELSSTERASLMEILFGKQRGNQGAALIQAFQSGQIQKAYKDIQNSAGSAYEEQARWMESLEAKTQQFESAFQSLSNTILDSGLIKWFVDFGTGAVSSLDWIIDKLGSLGSVSVLGAGILGAKGLGLTELCYIS